MRFNMIMKFNIIMKKLYLFFGVLFFLFAIGYSLFTRPVQAVCPICTVAVIGGLGLSRYFGIDDSISGIWIGGLMVSLTLWTVDWLYKRNWEFLKKINVKYIYFLTLVSYILLTYLPMFWAGIIGHPFNTILGIDKLIFGSLLGACTFILAVLSDKKFREIKGRQLFQFQKVAFPVAALLIVSIVLYFFGGYLYKL